MPSKTPQNLVLKYLREFPPTGRGYTNLCSNLVFDVIGWVGSGLKLDIFNPRGLLIPDPALSAPPVWPGFSTFVRSQEVPLWYYHSVFVLDGFVHDSFRLETVRVQKYLELYFGGSDLGLFLKDSVVIGDPRKSRMWSRLQRKRPHPDNEAGIRRYATALRSQFNYEWAQEHAITPKRQFEASAETLLKSNWKVLEGYQRRRHRDFSEGDTSTRRYFPISVSRKSEDRIGERDHARTHQDGIRSSSLEVLSQTETTI